jgi:hypothetical protein
MEAPNITMDSPSGLENMNSSLVSTEIPETGVLESESQVSDKPKKQTPLLTKPFVINTSTPKIELDGAEFLDVKTPNFKKPPVVAFDVDKTAKKLATDFKSFESEKKSLEQEVSQFNKLASTSVQTPELVEKQKELAARSLQLNTTANDLQKTARRVEIDRFELKKTAVRDFDKKAKQGGVFGATWNSIINGYKTTGLGSSRIAIDLGIELLDRIGIPWASKEDMKSMTKDEAKKKVIAEMTPIISKGYDVAKTKGTTQEYIEKQKKSGVIPRAWYGVMESANVMASGSRINTFVTGSVMGYQAINDEFDKSNDPELRNLDENSRKLVSLPIALVNGAIDVVDRMTLTGDLGSITGGARAVIAENIPRLAKFTSYVLSKLPKNATVKMITEYAKELAATPTGKMILTATGQLGGAYLAEGATGGLQTVSNRTFKEIYDSTNNMDLFKNPEFFSKQFLGKVAEDFNTEGVGGVMLRSIGMGASTLMTATGSSSLSDEAYQMWSTLAQDKDQRDLYFAKIKADLSSERITKEEAQDRLSKIKTSVDIASQIPTELPIASQKKAFGILNNNRLIENRIKELEGYMAGKNPNLVTSVQVEIDGLRDQINNNNTELSKLPKNAVQEQTTSEVPVQPETGVSQEVEQGVPQAEPKVPAKEGQSTEEINKEREAYGLEPLKPTYRGTSLGEWENVKNGGKFKSEQGFGENESDVTWVSDNKQYSDEYVNSNDNGVLIEFKPEAIDKSSSESGQQNDNTGVRLGRGLDFNDVQKVTDANGNVLYEAESKTPTQEVKAEEVAPAVEEIVPVDMSAEEFIKVQDLVDRIFNGEQITSPEDLQLQQNFPNVVEELLAKKTQDGTTTEGVQETTPEVNLEQQKTEQTNAVQKGIDAVNKALQRGRAKKEAVQGGIAFMQKTIAYEQADDVTREQMLRDINKEFGVKEKKAPSTKKILGEKPQTKTVDTMTVLKERIAEIDQAIKEGQRNFKTAVKDIATSIKAILPKGNFKPSQVKVIVNGIASNLLNPKLREQAMERIRRVVTNVEQATKLANMYNIRASLKDARKRNLDVNITNMVNNFIDIDPKFIDNFDEYLDYANRVYQASKAIKFVKDEDGNKVLDPRSIEDFAEIDEYSKRQLENQEEILKDNLLNQYKLLVDSGALNPDMSLQQIKAYIKSLEEDEKNQDDDKDKILMDYAKESFDESREALQNDLDDDAIDDEDRELIKTFIDIDISELTPMQAYEAAEALMNYRVNGSTSRMGKTISNYMGAVGVKEIAQAISIEGRVNVGGTKRLRYKALGKALDLVTKLLFIGKVKPNLVEKLPNAYSDFWLTYNSSLDNLGTTYFGPDNWTSIKEAAGLNKIIDGVVQRKKIIDDFTREISEKYKNKKIGDSNVFTAYNMQQLGIIAKLYRQTSNPKKQDAYFKDRKTILEQTIDYLNSSKNEEEKELGTMLGDIYEKLDIENAKSGQEIFDKADPVAKDIINDFINKFGEYYPDFARITQQQHNIILGNDRNYTADTWFNVSRDMGSESDKVFKKGSFGSNNIVDTEESGRFKEVKFPSSLKKVKGKVVNIPSYDFMQNNINALSETIGDIYTIAGKNQYAGFVDSPYFEQLIQDEDSRQLFSKRIAFDIRSLTNDEIIPRRSQTWRDAAKFTSYVGRAATKVGLSSIESVATQSLPVITATAVNLKNPMYMVKAISGFATNPDMRDFVNNSKYGISQRGPSSQTSIDYADNLLKNGDYSNLDKISKTLGEATGFLVNTALVGTDVVTAKASWLAYYMDSLGIDAGSIDWATHEVDDKAARYAERMVEREQNLNTPETAGKLWASKDPVLKLARSMMPFSGFSFKQRDKIKANMSTLFKENNLATPEAKVKAAKSLAGTLVEQYVFNAIKAAVAGQAIKLAYSIVGKKETKEEEELRKKKVMFQQIADMYETFNGSVDFLEKEAAAMLNNQLLILLENVIDKVGSGKEYDVLDLFKEPKEEKKKKRPYEENEVPKTQKRIKKEKLKKELKKSFRFYETADAPLVESVFRLVGGSAKVLSDSYQRNAFDGILNAVTGYFENGDGEKVKYNQEELDQLRLNIPFYMSAIVAPGTIPTTVSKVFNAERKIIKESADMRYKRKKAGRQKMMNEMNN